MKALFLCLGILSLIACQSSSKQEMRKIVKEPPVIKRHLPNEIPPLLPDTIVISTERSTGYKYNRRSGSPRNYAYSYDVSGYNDQGEYFYGSIDVEDKYGSGYIYDEAGNEIYIDVEWVDWGVLSGYDDDGNYYDLNVD